VTEPEHRGQRPWLRMRRWIDGGLVLVLSPLLIPLGMVAALAVFVGDRHAPTISFQRIGRGGGSLNVTKIRSMRPADDSGPKITGSEDNRITPVGALLRKLRIDELPQLLAVLRGEMAIIGPRPEDPAFVDLDDDGWREVLSARPGIAGLAQVIAGEWEETELTGDDPAALYRQVAVPAKVAIDRYYARHASPSLDWLVVRSLFEQFILGAVETSAHRLVADQIPEARALLPRALLPEVPNPLSTKTGSTAA
jgi:lipopolysaccharide/colanic/teichoic acid biosynthesis glycosyltransferase